MACLVFLICVVLLCDAVFARKRVATPKVGAYQSQVNMRASGLETFTLPNDLVEQLQRRYGPFRLANQNDYCPEIKNSTAKITVGNRWSYGGIAGDFNGDTNLDYSIIIGVDFRFVWLLAEKKTTVGRPYLVTNLSWPSVRHFAVTGKVMTGKLCDGVLIMGDAASLKQNNAYPYFGLADLENHVQIYKKGKYYLQTGYEAPDKNKWSDY
ncbi:MAG: hypothetical protein HQM16_05350 [Deltaproteobacteria bacterium]|nr:hypothetical protein [Deltaproteobacteria bacterium]